MSVRAPIAGAARQLAIVASLMAAAAFGGCYGAFGDGPETVAGGDVLVDTDGDGVPDTPVNEVDADQDGIPDEVEGEGDSDGDGIPDYLDQDSDGDGLLDAEEVGDGDLDTPPQDSDNDGDPD